MLKGIYGVGVSVVLALAAGAMLAQGTGVGPDSVTVKVSGLRNTTGRVWVGLWNQAKGFPEGDSTSYRSVWIEASQAQQGSLTTTFANLPPGEYAVVAMHDENRNEKLDKNFFGVPKEGWGVSNGFFSKTHGPGFDGARFLVDRAGETVGVMIRY